MRTGVVLGGGGPVGIAWEIGVLAGLADAGVVLDPERVVGTSAGSVVGAHLAAGTPLDELVAEQTVGHELPGAEDTPPDDSGTAGDSRRPSGPAPGAMERVIEIFSIIGDGREMTTEKAATIGGLALDATTIPEDRWIASFDRLLGDLDWPETDLWVTAVDCLTGERRSWRRADGVPLATAVASSCAVPGMFPPVSIDGRRYTDGGVWSPSNLDLLIGSDLDRAVFVGPISSEGDLGSPALARERDLLAADDITVELIAPGPAFAERIGVNLMDPSLRGVACEIGLDDGRAAADRLGV